MKTKRNGIWCLETSWSGDERKRQRITEMMDLLNDVLGLRRKPIHHQILDYPSLERHLKQWLEKKYKDYSILYLSFHGDQGVIYCGKRNRKESRVDLERLSDLLENRCKGKIIHFGSCSTLNVHKSRINRFLKKTGALAVSGYTSEIDWIHSAAFDFIVMRELLTSHSRIGSLNRAKREIEQQPATSRLARALGYKFIVRESHWPKA